MLVQRGLPAVAFLGALGLIVGLAFAGSAQRLASGATIAGIDVGGMTAAQARSTLARRSEALANQPVTFVAGMHTFRLRPRTLGLEVDWAAAVETARQQGEGFGPFRGFRRLDVRFFGADVAPATRVYEPALAYEVGRLATVVDTDHREAAIRLAGLTPVLVPGSTGQRLDRQAAAGVIARALASFERSPVGLPVHLDPPRVTSAQLRPVLAEARTVLSGPVRLTLGTTRYRLPRWRLATLLQPPRNGSRTLRIGGARADAYFGILARTVDRDPADATFAITSGNHVRIVPDLPGRSLDASATAHALLAAAVSRVDRTANVVVSEAPAARTAADARAMGITGLVSGYETAFGGDFNRVHNVQLVSHLVDDKLIAPGAEFSFNGTTGERTAAKGFLEAPVIINGELQTGLGGGICQVSTTIFNAAYEAGLKVTARTNHSLYISHYPLGRDATVNYPDTDLRFVNDTPHWLLLRTYVSSSSLVVDLFGTPQHRRVESVTAPLVDTGAPPVKSTPDPTLDKGQTATDSYGSPSRSTSVERKVYNADGKLLYDNTWYSSYRAEPQQVRVGTKPPPEPKPKPTAEPTPTAEPNPAETKPPAAVPIVPQPAIPDFTLPR